MKHILRTACFAVFPLIAMANLAQASTINPTDMRGIRESSGCAPFCLLNTSAVKHATEDRTVAHFDVSAVTTFTTATLRLSLQDQDGSLPGTSSLDVYAFAGDGTVGVDEWDLGTLFAEVTGITGSMPLVTLDITALLTASVAAGDSYLSFNLRNDGGDPADPFDGDRGRFFLSSVIGGVYDTISSAGPSTIELTGVPSAVVPLPAGGVLLLTGLGALGFQAGRKRRT